MGVYIQVDYTNNIGEAFKIEISDSTYSGVIYQVQGKAVLDRPKVKTMDMLRGSSLKIQLEASSTDTWITRLVDTVGDKALPVTLYKDGTVFWNGFIKPDGIVESFVTDYWIVSIQAIDGLGLLENIKFLNDSGDIYQGAMSEIDILTRCLELTGLSMQFRIYYINLFYTVDATDPTTAEQALENTYVNVDRYVKDDQKGSVFTAKEVLESLLKKYGAFICQQDNLWHIVRIIDFYTDHGSQPFALYDADGTFDNDYSASPIMNNDLGSDIDGYDPCHAGANQQKNYNAALGAYKVYYEYGIVKSVLENPKMYFDDGAGTIDAWTLETTVADWDFVLKDAIPGYPSGYYEGKMQPRSGTTSVEGISYDYITYDNDLEKDDILKIEINLFTNLDISGGLFCQYKQNCKVTLLGDSGTPYYLNDSGEWTLSTADINLYNFKYTPGTRRTKELTFPREITTNGIPEDGTITILFYLPGYVATDYGSYTVVKNIGISGFEPDIKGESWTATKTSNATAVVDVEDKVYVGDNDSDSYIGALEDSSGDNTIFWCKLDSIGGTMDTSKQFPLLNWLSRDRLTISGGNSTIFKGQILGYLPYLGVLDINNVTGIFMTTAWSYDTAANTITAEHERIFTDDIYSDVSVSFDLESENVIKPAIE